MSETSPHTATPAPATARKKNRRDLLLILGSIVFVIVSATILYRLADSGQINLAKMLGTSNRGMLVTPPRQVDDIMLLDRSGKPVKLSSLTPEWNFLIANAGDCPKFCMDTLYLTRQIRTSLGADSLRVRRILISKQMPIDPSMHALIQQEHEGLEVLYTTPDQFDRLFANTQPGLDPLAANTFFVVDPMGWLMMSYDQNNTYKDVIRDMKFLLKNSPK
jgi:hypothetical protein